MDKCIHITVEPSWFADRLAVECVRLRSQLPEQLVEMAVASLAREIALEHVCERAEDFDEISVTVKVLQNDVAYVLAHFRGEKYTFFFSLPVK